MIKNITLAAALQKFIIIFGLVLCVNFQNLALASPDEIYPIPSIKPEVAQKEDKVDVNGLPTPAFKPVYDTPKATDTNTDLTVNTQPKDDGFVVISSAKALKLKIFHSDRQARLTREIFDLQFQGKIDQADKKINLLNNKILLGHILAERYLYSTGYEPTYQELVSWIQKYSDHPQAYKIYKKALSRADKKQKISLEKPKKNQKIRGNLAALSQKGKLYNTTIKRNSEQQNRVQKLKRNLAKNIKSQRLTLALNMLSNDYATQFMDNVEYDHQRSLIAAGFMYAGKLDEAKRLSRQSLERSGSNVPMAGWIKGLVEWREGNYDNAAIAFQSSASSQYASGWLISASAYWASRAHMRSGNAELVSKWLDLAASYPRTFYGLIAIRALGHQNIFNWSLPELTREGLKIIENTAQGKRASALIKVGELSLAEEELKNLNFNDDVYKKRALLAYANKYNLASLMIALGNSFSGPKGQFYDAALYPVINYKDTIIDKSLVHGFIRQESRFNQAVYNASGAVGLMQLMPATANYVAGKTIYDGSKGRYLLSDADTNITLGQRYIKQLLESDVVGNDLIALAIAYNAGPGNLRKWKSERMDIKDPLLFIETIPYPETRAFVERVLANYWIYKMRFNEEIPSLDAVTEGKWAVQLAATN